VYPARGGFWDAVDCVGLFPSHPDFDHTGIVFDEITDPVVLFESGVLNRHANLSFRDGRARRRNF